MGCRDESHSFYGFIVVCNNSPCPNDAPMQKAGDDLPFSGADGGAKGVICSAGGNKTPFEINTELKKWCFNEITGTFRKNLAWY